MNRVAVLDVGTLQIWNLASILVELDGVQDYVAEVRDLLSHCAQERRLTICIFYVHIDNIIYSLGNRMITLCVDEFLEDVKVLI